MRTIRREDIELLAPAGDGIVCERLLPMGRMPCFLVWRNLMRALVRTTLRWRSCRTLCRSFIYMAFRAF